MARSKKNGRILLLLLLIFLAYKKLDIGLPDASPARQLQGEWHAHSDEYADIVLHIDEDTVRVLSGEAELCDELYSLDERTMLVTGAYRQDFELFALFEFRAAENGVNGRPVLIASAIRPDGGTEEIWFSKK